MATAPATSPTSLGCLPLKGSVACPMYQAFSIGQGFRQTNPSNQPHFSNITQFDAAFKSWFETSIAFQEYTKQVLKCPDLQIKHETLRYIQSISCALWVDSASAEGCLTNQNVPKLCNATISTFRDTYNLQVAIPTDSSKINPSVCDSSTAKNENQNTLTAYSTLQGHMAPDNAAGCIGGLDLEVKQCGFLSIDAANAYCLTPSGKLDQCCQSSAITGGTVTDLTKLLPIIAVSKLSAPTSQPTVATPATPEAGLVWGTGTIIGVAFASFVGLLALILFIMLLRKRRNDERSEPQKSFGGSINTGGYESRNGGGEYVGSNYSAPKTPITTTNKIPVAETMQVIYNYVPNLSDEIYLYVGDPIIVKANFDDGWGLGYNMTTKQEGSFPLACVGPFNNGQRGDGEARISQRQSSLYVPSEVAESMQRFGSPRPGF